MNLISVTFIIYKLNLNSLPLPRQPLQPQIFLYQTTKTNPPTIRSFGKVSIAEFNICIHHTSESYVNNIHKLEKVELVTEKLETFIN
jgi:hypothetical protein